MTAYADCVVYNSEGTIKVTIATSDISENFTKALTSLSIPKGKNQQNKDVGNIENNYDTRILDILGKLERRITITGYLTTGLGGSDSNSTAQGKANDLRLIFLKGGTFYLDYYAATGLQVNCDKLELKKQANDAEAGLDGVHEFDVIISLLNGVDLL